VFDISSRERGKIAMVPPKTDPKWEKLLSNLGKFPVTNLVTRVFLTKLMLMHCQNDAAKKKEAIDAAYTFFVKNETNVKDDIELIFG
jgi:hypothetical protein